MLNGSSDTRAPGALYEGHYRCSDEAAPDAGVACSDCEVAFVGLGRVVAEIVRQSRCDLVTECAEVDVDVPTALAA